MRPPAIPFALTLAAALLAAPARAGTGCTGPEVRSDGRVPPGFARALAALGDELRAVGDVDSCGVVTVFGAGDAVLVQVTLGDGRGVTRRVVRPDELSATVASLLVAPPKTQDDPVVRLPTTAAPATSSPHDLPPPPPAQAPIPREPARIEIGGGLSGRMSGAHYLGAGLGAFGQVALGRILLGATFRASPFEVRADDNPRGFHLSTSSLAAMAGRRTRIGPVQADWLGGPALVVEHEERHEADGSEISAGSVDVRLAAQARFAPPGSGFRLYGAVDGEVSPGRFFGESNRPDRRLPPLPTWSLGLSVGVTGGLL
jgi:hypothetical protein